MCLAFGLLLSGVGWVAATYWGRGASGREIGELEGRLRAQEEELALLKSAAGTGKSVVSIERATQQQLLQRIGLLESENAALKEDVRLLERLVPRVSEGASVRLENFRVVRDSVGRYRYRLMVVFEPDRQTPEFRGRLQLVITYMADGRIVQLVLPDGVDAMGDYRVEARSLLRKEGRFELPPAAVLQSVESRLLQGDTLKSKQLAQL